MKYKLTALVGAAIALGGMVSPAIAQMPGQYQQPMPGQYQQQTFSSTSFICGRAGTEPATLVQVNGRILPSPLIIWQTESSNLSPEERCQMVSQRMTMAVAQNGGRLSNLMLTTGNVNGYNVICFVNRSETCNANNVLMTLVNRDNARNPGRVLARLLRFGGTAGASGGFRESGGVEGGNTAPAAVSLEEAVNQLASEPGDMPAAPNPGGFAPNPTPDAGTGGGGPI